MAYFPRTWLSLILLATCCMAAESATSETIRVRGGEHEGFTRLALDLPRRLAWSVVERENRFDLIFEGDDLTFDLSAALSRLNSNRVDTIEQGQRSGVLQVGLDCECGADAFLFGDRMLVVDIRERDTALPPANRNAHGKRKQVDFLTTFWIDNAVLGADHEGMTGAKQHGNPVERPDGGAQVPGRTDDMHALMNAALHEAEEQRFQGVNLAIRNGAHPFEPQDRLAAMTVAKDGACLKEMNLNIAEWAHDGQFAASVGRLRSELYGEFDRSNRDTAVELAKVYIFFGFGLEARLILDEFVDNADHLKIIASLIETGTISGKNMFADALSCDNAAALWSVLSHDAVETGGAFDPSAVLQAFDRLPATLRARLAGNLSERFRSLGLLEDAEEVLRIAARSGVAPDPDARLASALVQKDDNRKDDASKALTGLTEQSYETSPRAMIELVSLKMNEDESIDYDTAQMARILLKEYAGSDLFPDLHFATVVALALSGAYAESLDELAGLRASAGRDTFRHAQDFLYDRISTKAPDPVFLSAALILSPDVLNELVPETVFKLAKRLVTLGFPDAALDLLGAGFRGHDMPEGRLLRAEARLHLGHADMAEVELAGVDGKRADRLRAQISEAKRDFGQALTLYRKLGDDKKVKALMKTRAETLADAGVAQVPADDPHSRAGNAPDGSINTAPLETSRKRVDASADTRRRVEALLAGALLE